MPSPSEIEQFIRAYRDHWTREDADLSEVLHPEGTLRVAGSDAPSSRDDAEKFVATVKQGIPDLEFRVLDWAERDGVVFTEWEMAGTLANRRVRWQGINRNTLKGARSVEAVSHWDRLSLLEQADPERARLDVMSELAELQD